MEKKVALITGIGGQDGSYLAEFLIEKGYKVRGIIRRSSNPNTLRFYHLIKKYGEIKSPDSIFYSQYADMTDASSIRAILEEFKPDEIYNLAAQSHVGISFQNPISTFEINALGTLKLLDAVRDMGLKCKFYQASSSEMFGISPPPQNEKTPFLPQSPYGISKVAAYHLTRMYRNAYGMFTSNGILFNHESPRRGFNFVTKKITQEVSKIVVGESDRIVLGNLDAKRDWGFSGEYIQAMWKILQLDNPGDFVISTGETHTVRDFLREVCALVNLDYRDYLVTDDKFKRPAEVPALLGDSTKARKVFKWEPKVKFKELAKMMLVADLKQKLEENGLVPIDTGSYKGDEFYLEKAREMTKSLKRRKEFINPNQIAPSKFYPFSK